MKLENIFNEFDIPSYQQWEETAIKSLKGKSLESLSKVNFDGFKINPLYDKTDFKYEVQLPYETELLNKLPESKANSDIVSSIGSNGILEIAYLLRTYQEYESESVIIYTSANVFENIAKIRALRQLLTAISNETEVQVPKIIVATSDLNKTDLDLENNIIRLTLECFSSVVASADYIYLKSYDSSNENNSTRITRNIYHLLNEESYINSANDSAKGSFFIEEMTEYYAKQSWEKFLILQHIEIEEVNLISMEEASKNYELRLERLNERKSKLVGVNVYTNLNDDAKNFKYESDANRLSEGFENLKIKASKYRTKYESDPKINLFIFGDFKILKPRIDFIKDFLQIGGFSLGEMYFDNLEEALSTMKLEACPWNVIISDDNSYSDLLPDILNASKQAELNIAIAGMPKDSKRFLDLGVQKFIHIKSNIFEELNIIWEDYS